MEWTEDEIVLSVNDEVHYTYDPTNKDNDTCPYDAPQYFLLNIAIQPSIDAGFTESSMEIDYIRVYQESSLSNNETVLDHNDIKLYPNPEFIFYELRIKNFIILI